MVALGGDYTGARALEGLRLCNPFRGITRRGTAPMSGAVQENEAVYKL